MDTHWYLYVIASIVIAGSLLYNYLTRTYNYWKLNSVPSPGGWLPGLGHTYPMIFFIKNVTDMYEQLYNQSNESMTGFYNLREPVLLVRDPELVKLVTTTKFKNFFHIDMHADEKLDPLVAMSPAFIQQEFWLDSRRHLTALSSPEKLKFVYPTVRAICDSLNNHLEKLLNSDGKGTGNVELELKTLFAKYTSTVVSKVAFGLPEDSLASDKEGDLLTMGKAMFEPSFFRGLIQVFTLFFPSVGRLLRLKYMPDYVDRFVRRTAKKVRQERLESGERRADFVQVSLEERPPKDEESAFQKKFAGMMDTMRPMSFLLDGYETSSLVAALVGYHLALHPEIQQRVREEVLQVIEDHEGSVTYDAIKEMKYMEQTFNESMRLFSDIGIFLRVCNEETELVGFDDIKFTVPKGMTVAICASGMYRDAKYWPEPEKFDPERFSPENWKGDKKPLFFPFGLGPRMCPGMKFAMIQMKAAMATILINYRFEISNRTKTPIRFNPFYFLNSVIGGLWVKVYRIDE